jgi:hypothetical protein
MKTPLRVRLWKSTNPEQIAESVNVSRQGIYFATNSVLHEGETVEVFFNMPEMVLGEPASEWRCTGHVVRVEAIAATGGKLGVGVQFDCYEVSRAEAADRPRGMAMPQRMIADIGSRTDQEDGEEFSLIAEAGKYRRQRSGGGSGVADSKACTE